METDTARASGHSMNGERAEALAETLQKELADTKEELRLTNELLATSDRVLNAVPECPVHGPCVPHAVEWIEKAKARSVVPEWPTISVLQTIPPEKRNGCYHLAIRREKRRPELGMLYWQGPVGWSWVDDEFGEIPRWATHCRFVDGEGLPIPWSEVGL